MDDGGFGGLLAGPVTGGRAVSRQNVGRWTPHGITWRRDEDGGWLVALDGTEIIYMTPATAGLFAAEVMGTFGDAGIEDLVHVASACRLAGTTRAGAVAAINRGFGFTQPDTEDDPTSPKASSGEREETEDGRIGDADGDGRGDVGSGDDGDDGPDGAGGDGRGQGADALDHG